MNNKSSVLVALLGVLIGVLGVLTYNEITDRNHRLRSELSDWRKLNLVLKTVDENYVDAVDHAKVTDAAVESALRALDPHSVYMPPQELKDSESDLAGNFEGIGIQFNVPNDTAIVIEVIPGGPSEKIGLQPGDRLLKVDDIDIAGVKYPQDSMVRRMKGPSGTKVLITVGRGNEKIPFEITRGKIPTHSVDAAFMVSDTTGYIRLSKFSRTTYKEFHTSSLELLGQGMKELIIDLRGNTGGFMEEAEQLANLFLPKNALIVYLQGSHRRRITSRADGKGFMQDIGLKVLIDEGSASASEILAGAIQDNDRGTIIGRRSFGKGLVQEPFYFNDNSGFRITVARYYTPSGRCIQKPYDDDYEYEVYKRYDTGEMVAADSIKVDTSAVYHTVGGRTVYGGGGITPDVFVPIDTTKVGQFYINSNRKATAMRFASAYFDANKSRLSAIDDYGQLLSYLEDAGLENKFLQFALSKDNLKPTAEEWAVEKAYTMTQVNALVGRYSKLGDNAFYHLYLDIDDIFKAAIAQ